MTRQPTLEEIFAVISAASVGDTDQRVTLPGELDVKNPATKLAAALNILLDDLEFRNAQVKAQYEALRRTEEQLRQSQKMESIGRLAGGVAHDFNNLLSVILSYGHILMSRLPPNDPMRGELGEIVKAGGRAANLTRQLLAFSRQQVVEPRVIDLNELIKSMDTMLGRLVGEDVRLVLNLGQELGRVKADVGHLEQVIMNLVINARDAMPDGGTLIIETSDVMLDDAYARDHLDANVGPHVMLAVSDTGSGMDEATRLRIFEPFFTTKERGRGTGLGLSTVYGIVKQNGGSIWVGSGRGKGTTFRVFLPCASEDAASAGHRAVPLVHRAGTETILLVEDDDQVRAVALNILRSGGYQVLEAPNPDDALTLSQAHAGTIHLLLTDVVMPGINGRELAERLQLSRPDMEVLFMSGYTDNVIAQHNLIDADSDLALLQKPFTPDVLLRRVRQSLESRAS